MHAIPTLLQVTFGFWGFQCNPCDAERVLPQSIAYQHYLLHCISFSRHWLMNAWCLWEMEFETSHVPLPHYIVDFTHAENILIFVPMDICDFANTHGSRSCFAHPTVGIHFCASISCYYASEVTEAVDKRVLMIVNLYLTSGEWFTVMSLVFALLISSLKVHTSSTKLLTFSCSFTFRKSCCQRWCASRKRYQSLLFIWIQFNDRKFVATFWFLTTIPIV